jgi:hypothetical protein
MITDRSEQEELNAAATAPTRVNCIARRLTTLSSDVILHYPTLLTYHVHATKRQMIVS